MKAVVQRVKETTLKVDGELISEIPFGLVVFLGVKCGDEKEQAAYLMKKIANLRVFEDENGKMNLSVKDVGGEVLLVSQFTLYGDCSHGNRPSFTLAARPEIAGASVRIRITRACQPWRYGEVRRVRCGYENSAI